MNREFYDLTNPQKSIWLTEQFYKGTTISSISGTLSFDSVINFKLLEQAINIFIRDNDGLRLQIEQDNNFVKQYISEYNFQNIYLIDVNNRNELDSIVDSTISNTIFSNDVPLYKFVMFRYPNGTGGFFLIINHMISDAWSFGLLANNVTDIYINLLNNTNISYQNTSYLDYIEAEQKYKSSIKYMSDKKYWEDKYPDIPELASFSNSNVSRSTSCEAERFKIILSSELSSRILEFCSDTKIPPFIFFLLIYSIYLGRISKMDCFNIGTPILNRVNSKEKKCIGMFINTLPFQININPDDSFINNARTLAVDELTIFRHQKYPYIELLQSLRKKYHSDGSLYDFLLSYQNTKSNADSSEISYHTDWNFNHNISESLNVHINDIDDTKSFNIFYDYQISKFSSYDIKNIHDRIIYIIEQVLSNPDNNISNYEIVTPSEKDDILYNFNATDAGFPDESTICSIFEEQVEKTPNNIAVKINDETITYKELNIRSNQLAHTLKDLGISNNIPVALRLNKSINMIVAIFGILKAGGCYLPIDLSYPQERINFMLKDSNCKLFITNSEHILDMRIDSSVPILNIDEEKNFSTNKSNLSNINKPTDTIYIIYTSGSTGTPKGVILSHRNVVRLFKNDKFLFDFNENDVWTMFHSVAFDFSVWEMYGALLFGGKLILVPESTAKDPFLFLDLLRKEHVTVLNQTPTFFYNLLDVELLQNNNNLSIRYIIFGGESLKPNLLGACREKYPSIKLINMYGITETTVHVTFRELTDEDLVSPDPIIGKPLPTLKVYIMNDNQKLMPHGIEGEICVSGLGVCKGYLNRPELNNSKFITNPYNPNEIIYRSGDSGYLDSDNNLHYISRIDNQVKIRGFRIELGEIEAKLLKHSLIEKCVVLPHKNNKDCFLVAYIVSESPISSSELKEYMRELVPSYMIPNYFIILESLPLTSNGKIDRKKLAALPINTDRDVEYVAPSNDFEKKLIDVIENTLGIDSIGVNDDIIMLGVDSLSLMEITISLIEKGISLNIQNFYEYRTVSNIAKNINHSHFLSQQNKDSIYNNFKEDDFSNAILPIKNILLTGSTGFLGIHILNNLIKYTDSTVYCLIRDKNGISPINRLTNKLHKYFNNSLDSFLGNRIKIINGDITKEHLGLSDSEYAYLSNTINTVIHSAAIVSHYGDKNLFKKINVIGTKNIIDFCKTNDIYLNHISTMSVSGDLLCSSVIDQTFNEHSIYIGQDVSSNVYVQSKLDAELAVYEALSNGLKASIYRLGNITARLDDGMFQDNYEENAFLNRILSFIKIQQIPENLLNLNIDLSPVDLCSDFIVSLLQYKDSYGKTFHICNKNLITFETLINWLNFYGYNIKITNELEFKNYLTSSTHNRNALLGIINDITTNQTSNNVSINSDYTNRILENHKKFWNVPDKDYLLTFIKNFL